MASMLKPVFCTSTCRRHTLSLPKQVAISENKYAIVNRRSSSYATAKKAASYASMKVSNNMRGHVILNALSGSPRVDEIVKEANSMLLKTRRSPPHWFTPSECENPPPNAPLLLYLPGIDGTGFGMALHHQALGELFEVQCLHIPYMDRTSFEGILSMVDSRIKLEHRKAPSRPLYILGECLGACIGLATAANNPDIDLSLILVNPGSCFSKSVLWPWFTIRKMLTEDLYSMLPFRVDESLVLAKSLPRETLLWRFRMLKSAESHTDSILQLVKHDILLIASGKDQLLPSRDEAFHLNKLLENCKIRYFKNAGHCILLEEDFSLTAVIKSVSFYRRSRLHDYVYDCLLPTKEELETASEIIGLVKKPTSPVLLSTNEHGQIVKGLDGIPGKGPVLFVGNHMLTGIEVLILVTEFFRERQIFLRGLAHPLMFSNNLKANLQKPNINDLVRLCGAVPVSGRNLFKLLSSKSHVLLYPGGVREALHSKSRMPHSDSLAFRSKKLFHYLVILIMSICFTTVRNMANSTNFFGLRKRSLLEWQLGLRQLLYHLVLLERMTWQRLSLGMKSCQKFLTTVIWSRDGMSKLATQRTQPLGMLLIIIYILHLYFQSFQEECIFCSGSLYPLLEEKWSSRTKKVLKQYTQK